MIQHGTRHCYQYDHCRCTPCRAANAAYQARLRRARAQGRQPLGTLVPAVDAWRKIRQMQAEHVRKSDVARRLGYRQPMLQWDRARMRLRTVLKVRRLFRLLMLAHGSLSADVFDTLNRESNGTRRETQRRGPPEGL